LQTVYSDFDAPFNLNKNICDLRLSFAHSDLKERIRDINLTVT